MLNDNQKPPQWQNLIDRAILQGDMHRRAVSPLKHCSTISGWQVARRRSPMPAGCSWIKSVGSRIVRACLRGLAGGRVGKIPAEALL